MYYFMDSGPKFTGLVSLNVGGIVLRVSSRFAETRHAEIRLAETRFTEIRVEIRVRVKG